MTANEKERVVDTFRVIKKFYTVNWKLMREFYPFTEVDKKEAKAEAYIVTMKLHNLSHAEVQTILVSDWTTTQPRQLWRDRKCLTKIS